MRERGHIKASGAKHALNTENDDEDPNPGFASSFAGCRYGGERRSEPLDSQERSRELAVL